MKFIDRYFELTARQTSIKKELIAGLTTFMAMSYILFVNPSMLAQTGMDHGQFLLRLVWLQPLVLLLWVCWRTYLWLWLLAWG